MREDMAESILRLWFLQPLGVLFLGVSDLGQISPMQILCACQLSPNNCYHIFSCGFWPSIFSRNNRQNKSCCVLAERGVVSSSHSLPSKLSSAFTSHLPATQSPPHDEIRKLFSLLSYCFCYPSKLYIALIGPPCYSRALRPRHTLLYPARSR